MHDPGINFDLLSNVLDLSRVRMGAFGSIAAGGDWHLTYNPANDISFCAVTQGTGCYQIPEMDHPVTVQANDIIVLSYPEVVMWAGEPRMVSPATTTYSTLPGGGVTIGSGDGFHMIAGGFLIAPDRESLFRSTLPPVIHIRGNLPAAETLRWLIAQLVAEMSTEVSQGRDTLVSALAQMLFVHSLRAYIALKDERNGGWLSVFANRQLTQVLASMHADPNRAWSFTELARLAGMSRSVFARRFRDAVGMTPLTYLAQWRLRTAMDVLRAGSSVADAAAAASYGSDRAFSAAFRRLTGTTPAAYRKAARYG